MNLKTFTKLELKNFLSGRAVFAAFACLALAAVGAVYQGGQTIEKQRAVIAETPRLQAEHTAQMLDIHQGKDLGDILYYHNFFTVHEPSSWAGFSVGQSDVNSFNVKVRMLALEGQLYDSDLTNPTNLLFGNFDLSFVIVFLFPLIIIALTHNLISAEQESGTWNLLRSQPVSAVKIIAFRMLLRFVIVAAAAFVMIAFGGAFLGADFDGRFVNVILLTVVYLAFWFGISAFVISFGKTSTANALTLLGAWIFLALLAPALLSSFVAATFPVSEALETTINQREGYHEKWDQPKASTMAKFYEKYPQVRGVPIPENEFSWGWYYAMQEMGDLESADSTRRYAEKLAQRQEFTDRFSWFLPTVNAQLQFNRIAATDLESHLAYLASVRQYHEHLRTDFYPPIFSGAKFTAADLKRFPARFFKRETNTDPFNIQLFALLAAAAFFVIAAWLNLAKSANRLQ